MAESAENSTQGSSLSAWLSTLIPTFIFFVVYLAIFLVMRKKQRRVYEPRSVVKTIPNEWQISAPPAGTFAWLTFLLKQPEQFLIHHMGVDGYFFTRFIFEFGAMALLGCFILWPILFPVNATGQGNQDFLSILGFQNILTPKNKWRYFAHVFLSWIFFGCCLFLIYRELVYYTTFRHAVQTTPLYDSLLSTRTLMLNELPDKYMQEEELRSAFPAATNIWYARDFSDIQKLTKERTKLAGKYEGAVNGVIRKAMKQRVKAEKKGQPLPEPADDVNTYLKDGKKRPTHRLKFLIGKKVDTLDYGKEHLGELNREIETAQGQHTINTALLTVFLEFPTQLELAKAYQAVPYNDELKKTRRRSGVAPDDVIWENASLGTYARWIRYVLANTLLTAMVIFWCIPVFVVGVISNINFIIEKLPWLGFINNMPQVIMGVITGLLPVVALAVLMSLVPPFIKFVGKQAGCLTFAEISMYCQSWYYAFLVVNSFIMMTIASAGISTITDIINDPTSAMPILGEKLPQASNFFIAYMSFQGLAFSSNALANVVALILAQFLGKILDNTPRKKWNRFTILGNPDFATLYPLIQYITIIALCYLIIAPLILGFCFIALLLMYFAYIYIMVYVQEPSPHDCRGRHYPKALFQLFTGLYLAEAVLIIMFVMSKNWACVALEAVIAAVTFACHMFYRWKFLSLLDTVPVSAIKVASGDPTYAYPMKDQGKKEIKLEGQNYWDGGNELGVYGSAREGQVRNERAHVADETSDEKVDYKYSMETDPSKKVSPFDDRKAVNEADVDSKGNPLSRGLGAAGGAGAVAGKAALGAPTKGVSWLKTFFKPKLQTFEWQRGQMPDVLFNYIEYNKDFVAKAYTDPCVTDAAPHIWIIRDPMGLSEIEKNKAKEHGVDVSDDNATFVGGSADFNYDGPPPSYEEAIKV